MKQIEEMVDLAAQEKNDRPKFIYKTEPWEHQKKALSYLYRRDAAALYTDMGTGKTKIMIDLIQSRGFKRVLVVAPNKACLMFSMRSMMEDSELVLKAL